jgi:hypothetical protein
MEMGLPAKASFNLIGQLGLGLLVTYAGYFAGPRT